MEREREKRDRYVESGTNREIKTQRFKDTDNYAYTHRDIGDRNRTRDRERE